MEIKKVAVSNKIEYPKKTEMHEITFDDISTESIREGSADICGGTSVARTYLNVGTTIIQIELAVISTVALIHSICLGRRAKQLKKKKELEENNRYGDNVRIDDREEGENGVSWLDVLIKGLICIITILGLDMVLFLKGEKRSYLLFLPILIATQLGLIFIHTKQDEESLKKGARRRIIITIILVVMIIGLEIFKRLSRLIPI